MDQYPPGYPPGQAYPPQAAYPQPGTYSPTTTTPPPGVSEATWSEQNRYGPPVQQPAGYPPPQLGQYSPPQTAYSPPAGYDQTGASGSSNVVHVAVPYPVVQQVIVPVIVPTCTCGKPLAQDAKFCAECGRTTKLGVDAGVDSPSVKTPDPDSHHHEKKKDKHDDHGSHAKSDKEKAKECCICCAQWAICTCLMNAMMCLFCSLIGAAG